MSKKTGVIYRYESPSGKSYIGQTWNEQKRRWDHRMTNAKKSAFHDAIKKYGKDSFKYEILHSGVQSQEEMDRLEIMEIEKFNSIVPNGYNIASGGIGCIHSEATKQKLRDSWVNNRNQRIMALKNAAKRPEVLARLRDNGIRNASNKDVLRKRSESLKAAFAKEDVRTKRSLQRGQEWLDEKIREKRIQGLKENANTPEFKEKMRLIMKERWSDPSYRERMARVNVGKKRPLEAIESARLKRIVKVECIETGQVFESVKSAAAFYGISHSNISSVMSGRQKTAAGKTWRKVVDI